MLATKWLYLQKNFIFNYLESLLSLLRKMPQKQYIIFSCLQLLAIDFYPKKRKYLYIQIGLGQFITRYIKIKLEWDS